MRGFNRGAAIALSLGMILAGSADAFDMTKGKGADGGKAASTADTKPVAKATGPNAYTVAEIYAQSGELDRKKVVVRARVAKVSKGIMGKNWVHLRDGSGEAEKGTNNLVATTQDLPSVGDVVTASGVLYKDKDFGAGYKYSAIVEEAAVKP